MLASLGVGTPIYASPEQLSTDSCSVKTDIFARAFLVFGSWIRGYLMFSLMVLILLIEGPMYESF